MHLQFIQSPGVYWRHCMDIVLAPISPKNLRLSAILIGIYQLLIAHVLLFLVLLGLAHAENMKATLASDIEDQKYTGFYDMTPFHNQLRLRTAAELATVTETLLYISTAVATTYLLSTLALFVGIYKNNSKFVLPWLIVEFIFIISTALLVIWLGNQKFVQLLGGRIFFYIVCFTMLAFDSLKWYVVHSFYQSVRTMNKLREIATVAIPCPAPGAIPFHFRQENMYLGSNGYKHILTESPDGVY